MTTKIEAKRTLGQWTVGDQPNGTHESLQGFKTVWARVPLSLGQGFSNEAVAENCTAADAALIAAAPETAAERDRLREVNAELVEAVRLGVATIEDIQHGRIGVIPLAEKAGHLLAILRKATEEK